MELLESWAAWARQSQQPPFVLGADRECLMSARRTLWDSWESAYTDDAFEAPEDRTLHLGLLPFPFSGDLRRATVYVLSLNPDVVPTDYYGEWDVREFREARLANLRQEFDAGQCPFVGLDPRFAWHGGFDYWHRRLRAVIAELATGWRVNFAEARRRLAHTLAIIESFPYHSENRDAAERWLGKLPSFDLARRFVHEEVLPRVRDGDAILIVLRQVPAWELPEEEEVPGLVPYPRGQRRGASLTPDSQGGKAILKHLLSTNVASPADVNIEAAIETLTAESHAEAKAPRQPTSERRRISATDGVPAGKRRCTHPDHNGDRLLPHTRDWFYRYPLPDGITDADVEFDPTLATWGSWCIDCRRADAKKKREAQTTGSSQASIVAN
jgi:hypothetical protein